MTRDLRTMEWTWHVDLDLAKAVSKQDLMHTAGLAWNTLSDAGRIQAGDFMVIAVVRPLKPQLQPSESGHASASAA